MYSIDDYIDGARRNNDIASDVKLSLRLGLSKSQVSYWRKRKSFPGDDVIARLALLAGENVDLALLHLNWWRAVDRGEHVAADHYKHMIDSFTLQAA